MTALLPPRFVESCQGPMLDWVVIERVDGLRMFQRPDHDRTATIEVGTEEYDCDIGEFAHPAMPWDLMWYPSEEYRP